MKKSQHKSESHKHDLTFALAGNPNCGKTTLFNGLTGALHHVGNWPGKTVERKEGCFNHKKKRIKIIDLPGIYSLASYSAEEIIARDYITEDKPDVIINIVDSTNLERNLYLTLQIIETGAKVVLALNMSDLAKQQGIIIDKKNLSILLRIPVVEINAKEKKGFDDLINEAKKLSESRKVVKKHRVDYGEELEEHLYELESNIKDNASSVLEYRPRWLALKLLENDKDIIKRLKDIKGYNLVLKKAKKIRHHLEHVYGKDIDYSVSNARYGFLSGAVKESVNKKSVGKECLLEKIDDIIMHKYLGIPIFLLITALMFYGTFKLGEPLVELVVFLFGFLSEYTTLLLNSLSFPDWLVSLVTEGIIDGVGSVLVFLPNIALLFFFIALLEDSGYMARAAFIMDRFMHKIGLHGKAFIPMIMGFGCNVPAIMATRILKSRKDRILSILINPFMSCSARLPIYILFVSAFFSNYQGLVIFSMYLLGLIVAVISGLLFKRFFFKGMSSPFVMELPPYRLPTLFGAIIHTYERVKHFVRKAGTVILLFVVLIWLLASFPFGVEYGSAESLIGVIGKLIAPVFAPLGFGFWQAGVALIFGIAAKEIVISTLGTLYSVSDTGLVGILPNLFTPLSAYAFMVFTLLYVPCIAAVATIKQETNWKWALFSVCYNVGLAWMAAFIVYRGGMLLGLG